MWIPVWVNVEKEPDNENGVDWVPTSSDVAQFVNGEVVNTETGEGWVITSVFSQPKG